MDTRIGLSRALIDAPPVRAFRETPLQAPPRIADTLPPCEAALFSRKFTDATVETYVKAMRAFTAFLGAESCIGDITAESISRYQVSRRQRAAATIAKDLTAIRSHARWCIRAKLRADDPTLEVEWPKKADPLPRCLSSDELHRLHMAIERPLPLLNKRTSKRYARDRIGILLMWYAGLRLSEVCRLEWGNVDMGAGTLTVVMGKGRKSRILPLHNRLKEALLSVPEADRVGAVIACQRQNRSKRAKSTSKHISPKTLFHAFDRYLSEFGLRINPHALRHAFAIGMLRNGANLRGIQACLGHRSLATTQVYLSLDIGDKQKAIETLPDSW